MANPLGGVETAKFSLKNMTPSERVEWANRNQFEVNAERAREGLDPIEWVLRDGRLTIQLKNRSRPRTAA